MQKWLSRTMILHKPKNLHFYSRPRLDKRIENNNEDDDDDISNETQIYVHGRHIYFSDDLTKRSCFDLKQTLIKLTQEKIYEDLVNRHQFRSKEDNSQLPIYLHINSNGGIVSGALDIVDLILSNELPIWSIVEGEAASAATLISCVCPRRFIRPNSTMMIHQIRSGVNGRYQDIQDGLHNITRAQQNMIDVYLKHTKMTKKQIIKHINNEKEFSATECLELGLVDSVV